MKKTRKKPKPKSKRSKLMADILPAVRVMGWTDLPIKRGWPGPIIGANYVFFAVLFARSSGISAILEALRPYLKAAGLPYRDLDPMTGFALATKKHRSTSYAEAARLYVDRTKADSLREWANKDRRRRQRNPQSRRHLLAIIKALLEDE